MFSESITNGFEKYFIEELQSLKHDCIHTSRPNTNSSKIMGLDVDWLMDKQSFDIPRLTPCKIANILNQMKVDKSRGIDMIRTKDITLIKGQL